MAKASLVIMAGGMASRYGSLKQLEKFGPNDQLLVDYSIFARTPTRNHIRANYRKRNFYRIFCHNSSDFSCSIHFYNKAHSRITNSCNFDVFHFC